ncbi:hypothetical protein AVEN_35912-1 [Araneus ventricosus]|uniref:Endonuclease/exonuclease/phosphatase domain-containing protein n=1 Tax=Araneus ventricosus TaxID=182803 RepID=A0A4Y2CUZ7_ARAVE|nr:hypothetical protein AVEN_35912-1 [Araneus ventricosus]
MASFVSWNCRDIKNMFSDLKDIINIHRPSVIALQETYLKLGETIPLKHFNVLHKKSTSDRATGCVVLLISNSYPSSPLTLKRSLQAIAVQIHTHLLIKVCSLYLPPNTPVDQISLNKLVSQLPTPFIILGDMNRHSPLWVNPDINTRGLQIDSDLHNSDHFPLVISDNIQHNPNVHSASRYNFMLGNWCKLCSLANITKEIVSNNSNDIAVKNVTEVLIAEADHSFPKILNAFKKQRKVWWNADCREAHKRQRKAWDRFSRNPTTINLINYKQAKANSRLLQRRSERK